jgi:uncharacterized protein
LSEEPKLEIVPVELAQDVNLIIGQSHFIKTVEDIYEVLVNSVPGIKFGLAFCESSGPRLVRVEGSDNELRQLASKNALKIGAGHSFVLFLKGAYPINVLNALKNVPEVCAIYCATANPVQVVVASSRQGRGIVGIIDGGSPLGVEGEKEQKERKDFLRKIGYKL